MPQPLTNRCAVSLVSEDIAEEVDERNRCDLAQVEVRLPQCLANNRADELIKALQQRLRRASSALAQPTRLDRCRCSRIGARRRTGAVYCDPTVCARDSSWRC